jgi:hypothetical protein
MDEVSIRNNLLRFSEDRQRTTAELWRALEEVKFWRYGLAKGRVDPGQAHLHIESAKRVVDLKLHALGIPDLPS